VVVHGDDGGGGGDHVRDLGWVIVEGCGFIGAPKP
jgi:hypothetical protein